MNVLQASKIRSLSIVLLGLACALTVMSFHTRVGAIDGGWFASDLTVDKQDDSIYSFSLQGRNCRIRDDVPIKDIGPTTACVAEGTKLKLAYAGTGIFVAKGRDQTFYPLNIPPDRYPILSQQSDRVIVYKTTSSYNGTFAVYEHASTYFTYSNGAYILHTSSPSFQYSQSPRFFTFPHLSADGHFAAYVSLSADATKFTVKIVSLETGKTTTVGYILDTDAYLRENYRDITVSDDGEYVAINTYARLEDSNRLFRTVQIWRNQDCDVEASVACETRLATENVPKIGTPSGLEFNDTATTLTLMNYEEIPQTDDYNYYRTTFSIGDLFWRGQLDYLAMGDSYSSGEGDTAAMGGHYRRGTNVLGDALHPREMCHVSDRSYPFLLQKRLMPSGTMQSVTCSGAVAAQDYTGSERGYKGQGGRLASIPDVLRSQMKEEALDISFLPGRNKQISFVKKYRPKAVTITGGGNDVGFGAIIKTCADPRGTCAEATSSVKISKLGYTIQSQYETLKELYKAIHDKSPKTKIYAVGYPQFVSNRDVTCAANVGLDTAERKLVREGVVMMNNVIEAAANAVGVKYIDIESSLGDAVLCGEAETEYVTGITSYGFLSQINEHFYSNESFHPNAMGHFMMARAIEAVLGGKSPIEYSYCSGSATLCPKSSPAPPLTGFFDVNDNPLLEWIRENLSRDYAQPLVNPKLRVSTDQLGPGFATVRIESTPRTLGTVSVGEGGVLDAEFTMPSDIEPGQHTLYVDALSPAGEPITLWQPITIYGRDGDLDGNGVDDALQPCPFVVGNVQDGDTDGIDDRCDPEIGSEDVAEVDNPPKQQYSGGEAPLSSNGASVGAKKLLQSEAQHSIKRLLSYTGEGVIAPASSNQPDIGARSLHGNFNDTPKTEVSHVRNRFSLISLSIIIFMVICIITVTGLTYAKTHPKKP